MLRLKKISSCVLCGAIISILNPTDINVFAAEGPQKTSTEQKKFGYLNGGMTYEEAKASDDNEAKNLVTKTKDLTGKHNTLKASDGFSAEEVFYEILSENIAVKQSYPNILTLFNKTLQRMKLKKLEEQLKEKETALIDIQNQLKEKETALTDIQNQLKEKEAAFESMQNQLEAKETKLADMQKQLKEKDEEDILKSHVLNLLLTAHSIGADRPSDKFSDNQHSGTIVSTAHGWGLKTQGINHENWKKACVHIEKAIYEILKDFHNKKNDIVYNIQAAYGLLNDPTATEKEENDKLKTNVQWIKTALESLKSNTEQHILENLSKSVENALWIKTALEGLKSNTEQHIPENLSKSVENALKNIPPERMRQITQDGLNATKQQLELLQRTQLYKNLYKNKK